MIFHAILSLLFGALVRASPFNLPRETPGIVIPSSISLRQRAVDPTFPSSPASCPICEANYSSIQNCAEASPVLANFTTIIFNPGAFIAVIQCSCTETFQSVFPQCVDCFEQTNQTDVLGSADLPSVLQGMRNICALESTLLGSAAATDGELPSSTGASAIPTTTAASNSETRSKALPSTGKSFAIIMVTIAGLGFAQLSL
ncbi:hypothetical protein C8R41DRAFT_766314 [Lentinula lateritia]|uniref:Uncharacterized protein n=1 Tax=Lentinula lateritia TaxID=40482 RepID=A0ABQ8VHN5_9AGAR|nr:hypothetical protein C8R41DRAFT_766314 [Lentinula lateritia]